ncbi:GGDEF domain-containing protein [Rhizobium sp. P44RR-XXIV]|uniref:GGDEF domain-containing protein n=1 Tax=Rhizobium sp. P44RR-XXIV TaxID=1921145 RepID=UPI00197FE1C0|nr:GGDEF domain-containing protein [Rhizobium sp. P44RR-XXIV]
MMTGSRISGMSQRSHDATHDFMTGLPNSSLIAPEFARLSAAGDITVSCLDLDEFKEVNDQHGHAAGDNLLRQVVEHLRKWCRNEDLVFRLGGDEFAILMPFVTPYEAELRCRQLSLVLSNPYLLDGVEVVVGASFGMTDIPARSGRSCDAVLKAADEALYQAKARGRGHVIVSSDRGQVRSASYEIASV